MKVKMNSDLTLRKRPDLAQMVNAWLDEKEGRSGSAATRFDYQTTFAAFVIALERVGLAFDDAANMDALILCIQGWAGQGRKGKVTAATYNHRVSIVSSFYEYARRARLLTMDNPAS